MRLFVASAESLESTLHTEPTESCEFPPSVGADSDGGGVGLETYDGQTAEVSNSTTVTEEPVPQEMGTGAWNQYGGLCVCVCVECTK